jgi:hypothetical protein
MASDAARDRVDIDRERRAGATIRHLILAMLLVPWHVQAQAVEVVVSCREGAASRPLLIMLSAEAGARTWREWDEARLAWGENQCAAPAAETNVNTRTCDFSVELQLAVDTTGTRVVEIDRISGDYARKGWYVERGQRDDLDIVRGRCEKASAPSAPEAKF